jgi:hypothetical protein
MFMTSVRLSVNAIAYVRARRTIQVQKCQNLVHAMKKRQYPQTTDRRTTRGIIVRTGIAAHTMPCIVREIKLHCAKISRTWCQISAHSWPAFLVR